MRYHRHECKCELFPFCSSFAANPASSLSSASVSLRPPSELNAAASKTTPLKRYHSSINLQVASEFARERINLLLNLDRVQITQFVPEQIFLNNRENLLSLELKIATYKLSIMFDS